MTEEERQEWTDLRDSYPQEYLFWHTEPSAIEDFANSIQEMYYSKKCTYKEICKLNKNIIKLHSKK